MRENKNSFLKGWGLLIKNNLHPVKNEIMQILNIKTDNAFIDRRKGKVNHNEAERKMIENIFDKYNVNPNNIWG